jgi:hypothetical protein
VVIIPGPSFYSSTSSSTPSLHLQQAVLWNPEPPPPASCSLEPPVNIFIGNM